MTITLYPHKSKNFFWNHQKNHSYICHFLIISQTYELPVVIIKFFNLVLILRCINSNKQIHWLKDNWWKSILIFKNYLSIHSLKFNFSEGWWFKQSSTDCPYTSGIILTGTFNPTNQPSPTLCRRHFPIPR